MKRIKKLNNKGMTAVEILVCFILVVVLTVSMYTTVSSYKNKQQIESFKEKIYTYKNLLSKDINDDLIKTGLVDAKIVEFTESLDGNTYSVDMYLRDGTIKRLKIESIKAYDYLWDPSIDTTLPAANDKNDKFMISYGNVNKDGSTDLTDYPIPDLGESFNPNVDNPDTPEDDNGADCGADGCIIKDFRINNVNIEIVDGVLIIYIGFYHPELGTRYAIDIICPINY